MTAFFLATALVLGAQDVLTFRSEVRRVFVDAFATRGGVALVGLTANDLELHDDGVLQEIELVRTDALPLSVLTVLDTSGSLDEGERRLLSEAARTFLSGLDPRDEIGLLSATHRLALRLPLTREHAALPLALAAPMPRGATSIRDAVFAALTLVGAGTGRPVVVVLTDGNDNTSWLGEEGLLETARRSESLLYILAPERSVRADRAGRRFSCVSTRHAQVSPRPKDGRVFFRRLAAATGGELLDVRRPEELPEVFEALIAQIKSRYLLVYEPRGVPESGWHELEVKLVGRRGEVRARAGYWGEP